MTSGWRPSTRSGRDRVTAVAARALHDLLEREGEAPRAGDPLPLLWHWLAFLPQARPSELAADGHPATGGFLPPTGDRRRMFGGGSLTGTEPLRVEEPLVRVSTVSDVAEKLGRTGPLLFVTVDHQLTGAVSVRQEQDTLVYRGQVDATTAPSPVARLRAGSASGPGSVLDTDEGPWSWSRTVVADPVMLFSFSALTYNSHRIHYDRRYAEETEGYPGLVVHGPLQALLLADLLDRSLAGMTVTRFSFQSRAPAFDGAALELRGRPAGSGEVELAVFTAGLLTMSATATVAPFPRSRNDVRP